MMRKSLISFAFVIAVGASVGCAMANSTIYTDDLGRMHFLGKDPGGRTLQQVQDFNNPAQKDLTDIIYKNNQEPENGETKVNTTVDKNSETNMDVKGHTNKSKGSFTFNKGAMDASDPYTYGETNIAPKKNDSQTSEKKHFWDNW